MMSTTTTSSQTNYVAIAVGLGVGLGVGIPTMIVILLLILLWIILTSLGIFALCRRRRRMEENRDIEMQDLAKIALEELHQEEDEPILMPATPRQEFKDDNIESSTMFATEGDEQEATHNFQERTERDVTCVTEREKDNNHKGVKPAWEEPSFHEL